MDDTDGSLLGNDYGDTGGFFTVGTVMNKLDFREPDQLQTRDGMAVRIYATDGAGAYPIHGTLMKDSEWVLAKWTIDGRNCNSVVTTPNDLVRKPARVTGWLNIYNQVGSLAPQFGDVAYATQQLAKERSKGECFGQIYVDAEVQQ